MDEARVRVLGGPFEGLDGTLVARTNEAVVVRLALFGRPTDVTVSPSQVVIDGLSPEPQVHQVLRDRIVREHDVLANQETARFAWERVDLPEADPAEEWDRYLANREQVHAAAADRKRAALDRFDRELTALPAADVVTTLEADPGYWLPGTVAAERSRADFPEPPAASDKAPSPGIRARLRMGRARDAAEARAYERWRASHGAIARREWARAAAAERVREAAPRIRERFARDWGMDLPDPVLMFREFLLTLGPGERDGMADLDLRPCGLMDVVANPDALARPGLDVRLHFRYYCDPPEFVTFLHGGSDGLHFGLWFDDGRSCAGVASYYNNDGGGVGVPSGSPLAAVRGVLELTWASLDDEDDKSGPLDPGLAVRRHRLRLLRETLMLFDTGDRPETGRDYHDAYWRPDSPVPAGLQRIATLDGGGALVAATATTDRRAQQPGDDNDLWSALHPRLEPGSDALTGILDEALGRCEAGDPAQALALGRDLHWVSGRDHVRERLARDVLVAAYREIGRPALADIADLHFRYRDLPSVDVLDES